MWRWERRDRKQQRKRSRMPKDGRGVFDLQRLQVERSIQMERRRQEREQTET